MSTAPAALEIIPDEVKAVIAREGLDLASVYSFTGPFVDFLKQAEVWATKVKGISVTEATQIREMKLARETRLALREIRTSSENTRKRLKENSLRVGKAIDGMHAVVRAVTEPLEETLLEQEKFVERQEAALQEKLKIERTEELTAFGVDVTFFNLGAMPEETYVNLLATSKLQHEAKLKAAQEAEAAKIAAAKAEADRIEAQRVENEQLKAERAKKDAELKAERDAAAKAKAEMDAKLRTEQAASAAALRAEQDKRDAELREVKRKQDEALAAERAQSDRVRKEQAAREEQERQARLRAEAELKVRKDAEVKAEAERVAAARKAASAPDKEKIMSLAGRIREFQLPEMHSADGINAQIQIMGWIDDLADRVEKAGRVL